MALMAPKEATMVQFAPGPEAGGADPSEPYRGPAPGWYYGESLNAVFREGFEDGQG